MQTQNHPNSQRAEPPKAYYASLRQVNVIMGHNYSIEKKKEKLQDTIPLCLSLFLAFWISPLFSSRQKQIMFSRIICLTKIINLRRKSQEKKIYNSSVINNMTLRLRIVAHSIFVNPDVLFLNNLIITIIRKKDLTFEALSYFSNKKESIYITKL